MAEDYAHEVDTFEIPEEYLKMSPEELERESDRLLQEMKSNPQKGNKVIRLSDNPKYLFEIG